MTDSLMGPGGDPSRQRYRTIFLSDIHLGTRGCRADRLLDFLKQHTCDRLYLVGDIVDGWRLKSQMYWPQDHSNVLRRFLTLAKRGTEVIYVTGNHDEFLRKYSDMVMGNLTLVDEAEHRTAAGQRLLVVHGDQFDVITRYHRWVAVLGDVGYTILLELNRWLNRLRSRIGLGHWSLSAWIKQRVKRAVSYIGEFEEAVSHECHRRGFDGVICGHIHHAEITEFSGTRYMNCGDWVESCTALVEDDRGEFFILDWAAEAAVSKVVALQPKRLSA
ncbi:MAG: UDP-2,3-diacylglucosamine diphosphatase [Pseudomonadales bacterium]